MDGEPLELGAEAAAAGPSPGGLDGDDDVAERDAAARGVGLAGELLEVEGEDVGGAVVVPVGAVEDADLVVVGVDEGRRRAAAALGAERGAHAGGDLAAGVRIERAAGPPAHNGRDRHA